MFTGNDYANDVLTRVFDFFTASSRWQRGLWNVGLVLALREFDLAVEAAHQRVLSDASLRWQANSIRSRIADDVGVGDAKQRAQLTALLESKFAYGSVSHHVLRLVIADIDQQYLSRWEAALAASSDKPSRERAARSIAAYMLDLGFSQPGLKVWLHQLVSDPSGSIDLPSVVAEARALAAKSPSDYEVLVPFLRTPAGKSPRPEDWLNPKRAARWLAKQGLEPDSLPAAARGALLIRVNARDAYAVNARDAYAAVPAAAAVADRVSARVAVGTRTDLVPLSDVFVGGIRRALVLRPGRRLDVLSLDRHKKLYDASSDTTLDSAIELVSYLDSAPGPVAVAAGWSGIEFLLRSPGDDNVAAADRLAALVACSWPRAELTAIAAARINSVKDALSSELASMGTNRERCDRLLDELTNDPKVRVATRSDRAAVHRVKQLLTRPAAVLEDVRSNVQESLRRLYRQRNLVVHGGVATPILDATLRTAAPLVGAGLDRIAHASLAEGRTTIETAARAEFELTRAGTSGAPAVTALLE